MWISPIALFVAHWSMHSLQSNRLGGIFAKCCKHLLKHNDLHDQTEFCNETSFANATDRVSKYQSTEVNRFLARQEYTASSSGAMITGEMLPLKNLENAWNQPDGNNMNWHLIVSSIFLQAAGCRKHRFVSIVTGVLWKVHFQIICKRS